MIGLKVIALESSRKWGYEKGDTLEITESGRCGGGPYVAKNITRPYYGGRTYSIIHEQEFKVVKNQCEVGKRVVRIVKILGIAVYKEVIEEAK